jgi:leucyl aminopeptidase
VAINDALQRWRHLHQFMLFYDLDEFLVLPRHTGLAHFVADYSAQVEPIVALRSMCSWGQLNLTTPRARAANISTIAAVALVRDLINTPASDMGPAELAEAAVAWTR